MGKFSQPHNGEFITGGCIVRSAKIRTGSALSGMNEPLLSLLITLLGHVMSSNPASSFCVCLQAFQPDSEEADHAEGAGQRPHLGGHRRQTAGTRCV